jgi:exonuclease V gamma subunit
LAPGLDDARALQQAQQRIFAHIVEEPDGRRARLNRGTSRNFKTLPQYVKEVMELPAPRVPAARALHIFGLTQISPLHIEALAWLSRFFDLRVYGLNPLVDRLEEPITPASMQQFARGLGDELLGPWARAGAESLHLVSQLLQAGGVEVKRLPRPPAAPVPTVLGRLQEHLLGSAADSLERLPQDTSLQIVGCPGIVREVETVHNSILQNLHDDKTLRLSEVAVLVTDMARYRPALHAVFDRPPHLIPYSLIDFSAAGASAYGKALLGMLDLALESFTRSAVFEVLHNPCFLARLGITQEDTRIWESWTEALGVHHGWDAAEKGAGGLPESALYSWRLALQRLRLGRCMQPAVEDQEGPAPRFGDVLPYADLDTGDRDQLALFCQAVEGLLTALVRLRTFHGKGRDWAERLRGLMQEFLDIPPERPEEAEVRDRLLAAVAQLELWDHVAGQGLPLALVREFLHSRLEGLEARRGAYLTAGVTIAALQPMRPVPFRILYVLGLNEHLFPGSNQLAALDLRQQARRPGDIPRGDPVGPAQAVSALRQSRQPARSEVAPRSPGPATRALARRACHCRGIPPSGDAALPPRCRVLRPGRAHAFPRRARAASSR